LFLHFLFVFTSLHDDDFGGDTNNNQQQTLPQSGDWSNLQFASNSLATLKNVQVRYAGKNGVSPLLLETNAQLIKENVSFFP
jgi:hypothetical protein